MVSTPAPTYLVRPCAIDELVARLRTLGRRALPLANAVIRYGDIVSDSASRELLVGDGRASLFRSEGIVLDRCLRAPDRVITKAQLGDSLQNEQHPAQDRVGPDPKGWFPSSGLQCR